MIHTATPVTACAFSTQFPNLLAVGTEDGTVAVYDIKQDNQSEPLVASLYASFGGGGRTVATCVEACASGP